MANIVFVLPGFPGHLFASFKLARSLTDRGHTVSYAVPEGAEHYVTDQGLPCTTILREAVPPEAAAPSGRIAARVHRIRRQRAAVRAELAAYQRFFDEEMGGIVRHTRAELLVVDHVWPFLALAGVEQGIPVAILSSWLPQTRDGGIPMLNSSADPSGPLGERLRGELGWARHLLLRRIWRRPRARLLGTDIDFVRLTRRLARRAGFPRRRIVLSTQLPCPMLDLPQLYSAPAELDFTRNPDPNRHYIESGIDLVRSFDRDEPVPWDRIDAGRPLFYCSFGSQSHLFPPARAFFAELVGAFAERPQWQLVLVVGEDFPEDSLPQLPDNVVLLGHASPMELLGRADAVVSHAGLNSVKEAVWFGLPSMVVPLSRERDQFGNAARVQRHGLGVISSPTAKRAEILAGLERLLDDPLLRSNTARMRDVLRAGEEAQSGSRILEGLLPTELRNPVSCLSNSIPSAVAIR